MQRINVFDLNFAQSRGKATPQIRLEVKGFNDHVYINL